jgi:hypothetical protein
MYPMVNIDLGDILTYTHVLAFISEGNCCYSDQVECHCTWRGSPDDYGLHLLSVLGQEETIFNSWIFKNNSVAMGIEVTPIQREEYLNLWRDPKKKRRISKEERKRGFLDD